MLDIVVLCGGNGTRLWPISRSKYPKQFVKLIDEDYSLLQMTALRAKKLNPSSLIFIVNANYDFIIKKQLDDISLMDYKIISEPESKNTSPAIAIACNIFGDDSNILVMASDHIWDDDKFINLVNDGLKYINDGIVFFAIKPTNPNTEYGYIKFNGNKLVRFVEKPNYDNAVKFITDGTYYWNSGVFLFKNSIMKNEFNKKYPNMLECTKNAILKSVKTKTSLKLDHEEFGKVENISIDYAIMESYNNGYIVMYDGLWSDVGSYDSIHKYLPKDDNNNVANLNNVEMVNTYNCYIKSDNRLIATIGLNNTIIVDTKDALLVADINRCKDIKTIVSNLDTNHKQEKDVHLKEFRPWGWYETIDGNDHSGYKVKRIHVYPGMKLSLQSHTQRSEHWVITKGNGKVTIDDKYHILGVDEYAFISIGTKHRIENIGDNTLEFIETQIGEYLGEDDIIRYEDDWGRK